MLHMSDELVEIFLKLSMKTVQVHLIIGTTLVSHLAHSSFTQTAIQGVACCIVTRYVADVYRP